LRDAAVLEAVLFGFLTVLRVNEDKKGVARGWGREVVETREWVGMVFGRLEGMGEGFGGEGDGERCRVLAAGVLVGVGEVVEGWRGGEMGDFM